MNREEKKALTAAKKAQQREDKEAQKKDNKVFNEMVRRLSKKGAILETN